MRNTHGSRPDHLAFLGDRILDHSFGNLDATFGAEHAVNFREDGVLAGDQVDDPVRD
jgi:hypothetical protein